MANIAEPKYKVIEKDLFKKIQDGFYPPDTLIPREVDLMEQYKVSRPTVRQAIQRLVEKGILEKRKKRGTIVKQTRIAQQFTQIIEGYNDEMSGKGLIPKTKVILFDQESATTEVAKALNIDTSADVFKLVRLRYVNAQPVVLITSYIPALAVPNIINQDFSKVSLYATLKQMGYEVRKVKRRLEVITADETGADLLNVHMGDPLFYFHTQGYTQRNLAVEYSVAKYRGDINYFEMEIQR